jgi:hypothetical protein
MAWNNADELVVGGTGQAYVAPEGTTLPTTTAGAVAAGFVGLGYHSEDGVSLTVTPNIQEFPVWQSRQPARRESLATEITSTFSLAQWDEDTVPLAFGGGSISGSSPNYRYDFPADDGALPTRALVIDVVDGDETFRFVWERINVTEATTIQFNRSNLALLPIGAKVLAPSGGGSPGYFLTNSAAFAAGS